MSKTGWIPGLKNTNSLVLKLFILTALYSLCACTDLFAQEDITRLVDKTILLFNDGKFKEAELTALRALQNSDSLASADQAELHRILAFSYVAQEENEKAKRQFMLWLEFEPLANLDPIYISPKIISVFNEAKTELEQRKNEASTENVDEMKIRIAAFQRSLIFPGRGQLYRGEKVKGISLVSSEIVMLGALLYCHLKYDQTHDRYLNEKNPDKISDLYNESNLYYQGRIVSASLAAGIYLYSLIDAAYLSSANITNAETLSLKLSPDPERLLTISFRWSR
ncbi:MAG: DUF5683 domain-containing protein [bacterium]|nr:DUF5683 domain-containing protein [bacterium]